MSPPHFAQTLHLGSLFDDLTAAGHTPTTTVLRHTTVEATRFVAARLGITPGQPLTYLRRLRLVDGHPLAVLENYLTHELTSSAAASLASSSRWNALGTKTSSWTRRFNPNEVTPSKCHASASPVTGRLPALGRCPHARKAAEGLMLSMQESLTFLADTAEAVVALS